MPTRSALRSAPTTSDLRAFLAGLGPDTDAAILRAVAIIDALKAPYASASRRAHVRRVARELVVLAVRGESTDPLALGAARSDADARLSTAVDTTVDCDGSTFYEEIRASIREIRATTDRFRREVRADALRKSGDLSHLPRYVQDYHRAVRAAFAA